MAKRVRCPACPNKRLMDMIRGMETEIEIKCPRCDNTINLLFINNQILARKV